MLKRTASLLTLSSSIALLAAGSPAMAGFDWISGERPSQSAASTMIDDLDGQKMLSETRANRSPEIYIKRQKISPRDARAELEKQDYDEITMMNALVIEEPMISDTPAPMVMQNHSSHGPVQIVPVRPNYSAPSSNVVMNTPQVMIEPPPAAPVAALPPMIVADEPLPPIGSAPAPKSETMAMTFIPDPNDTPVLAAPKKRLSINPYPQAGLEMPTARNIEAPAPSNLPALAGFGNDLPLVIALQQVIPPNYRYQFAGNIDLGQTASWSGGKAWNEVLTEMLSQLGLSARINGNAIQIFANQSRV